MGIATTELTPIEQTAFLTEYARALDSQWSRPILGDTLAHEVVGKIDYDFAGLGVQTSVVCQTALRAKMLDDRVRAFAETHPDAVVVDLGAGLDSGSDRVDPPATVDWYSVDLPGITALRDEVLPAPTTCALGAGLVGRRALARHHPGGPPDHADRRRAVRLPDRAGDCRNLPPRSPTTSRSGELAFNDYGGIGWVSRLAIKLYPQKMFKDVGSQFGYLGFKDAHHPETWNPRMQLVEEASLTTRRRSTCSRPGSASPPGCPG